MIATTAKNLRPTSHVDCAGGVDLDVSVSLPDGRSLTLGATVHPARDSRTDCQIWIPDGETNGALQRMAKRLRRQVLDAVEFCARRAAADATSPKARHG
jgi:hypothetical protein